jgi:hypothetical protein
MWKKPFVVGGWCWWWCAEANASRCLSELVGAASLAFFRPPRRLVEQPAEVRFGHCPVLDALEEDDRSSQVEEGSRVRGEKGSSPSAAGGLDGGSIRGLKSFALSFRPESKGDGGDIGRGAASLKSDLLIGGSSQLGGR